MVISFNLIAVLTLCLAYVSTYISPAETPYIALFGIGYGLSLVANLLFILFWILVKKRFALLSTVAILAGFTHLAAYYQLLPAFAEAKGGKSIHLVSQNVRLFGWYNWRTNQKDRDLMIENLQGEAADVYCFQEFFSHRKPGVFDTKSILRRKLSAPYVHEVYPVTVQGEQQYGTAIFSKYPIVNRGQINFDKERSNLCLFADIVKEGDTLRVYSAHLASIRFSDADYRFIEELGEDQTKVVEGRRILQRLNYAYKRRALQVEKIVAHTKNSPHKVIVCGDFNDTPVSYTYAHLTQDLRDSFRESGWGIGNTYRGKFPSFRIDYILHSPNMTCADYKTLPEQVSDHHAISSRMVWD